jgi:cellulose synthase/poly-beta-1,6-N-acetylglucosamine synthase-like glycosyltransferase
LKAIYVIADDCSDKTIKVAQSTHLKELVIVDNKKRKGKAASLNMMFKKLNDDIVVVLDADIVLQNKDSLENLIKEVKGKVGLVGGDTIAKKGSTFVQKVLTENHKAKTWLYRHLKEKNNVYVCHGRIRAFAKSFYKNLEIDITCPEDAYTFFAVKKIGMNFLYASNAAAEFSSPATMKDHLRQSGRFASGIESLKKVFGEKRVESEYKIPMNTKIMWAIRSFLTSPIYFLTYIGIYGISRQKHTILKYENQSIWKTSESTKTI